MKTIKVSTETWKKLRNMSTEYETTTGDIVSILADIEEGLIHDINGYINFLKEGDSRIHGLRVAIGMIDSYVDDAVAINLAKEEENEL